MLLLCRPVDTQGKCHLAVNDFSRHTGIWVTSLANSQLVWWAAWRHSCILNLEIIQTSCLENEGTFLVYISYHWAVIINDCLLSMISACVFLEGVCIDTLFFLIQKRGLNRARIKFIAFCLISSLSVCLFCRSPAPAAKSAWRGEQRRWMLR